MGLLLMKFDVDMIDIEEAIISCEYNEDWDLIIFWWTLLYDHWTPECGPEWRINRIFLYSFTIFNNHFIFFFFYIFCTDEQTIKINIINLYKKQTCCAILDIMTIA